MSSRNWVNTNPLSVQCERFRKRRTYETCWMPKEILKKYMLRCRNARAQKRLPHRHSAAALLRFFSLATQFQGAKKKGPTVDGAMAWLWVFNNRFSRAMSQFDGIRDNCSRYLKRPSSMKKWWYRIVDSNARWWYIIPNLGDILAVSQVWPRIKILQKKNI